MNENELPLWLYWYGGDYMSNPDKYEEVEVQHLEHQESLTHKENGNA